MKVRADHLCTGVAQCRALFCAERLCLPRAKPLLVLSRRPEPTGYGAFLCWRKGPMQQSIPYQRRGGLVLARGKQWGWVSLPLAIVFLLLAWKALVELRGYQAFILPAPDAVALRMAN